MIEGNVDNALANLPFGSHLGLIYQGPTDWLPLLATAIRASLQRGERWIHFADANTVPSLRYALQAEGVNLDGAQRWGVFRFITPREWLGSETREPHGLLDGLPRHVDEALACGLAGLRVSVEVSAFLATLDDPRQWTDFEFAINTALPGSQSSGIFLYSQLELSVTRLRAALYLHPLVMLDNRLYPSIYYVPPEAAADEVAQRFHLNSMFERIRQTAAAERMQARERPQGVISELVAEAFGDTDLTRFAQKAAARVATCLGTEYTKVLELLPGGTHLLLRAGVGWRAGLVNHATVDAGIDSQAGYTLLANQPVIVDDLRTETRFHGPPLLVGHRVVSGMSTIIHGRDRPWGVLGTHTITRRRFTDDEVSFLQAVADVLSLAVERRQLADAHAQLIAIVESSTTAIIGTDRRGVIVGWNPGAESLLGFAPAEVVGQTISILVPAGPGEVPDFLREWIERGESVKDRDTTLLRSDGQLVDVSLALSFTGPEGGAVLVVRDMTDQKRLESERAALLAREQAALARAEVADAVRKNEARFHRLVENIQDYAITLVDPQGRVASWNDGAQRIFGYREDEVLGKHISLFYTPEDLSRGKAAGRISHA
ncbi:MAG TPA: PAS domain S-box protein, partial [Chloroflexota bacterium]|nr:PAS domain S-box protein [Chloroflexota bacterium]